MYKAFNNLYYPALIQLHSASLWTWPLSLNVVFRTAVLSGASIALDFLWGSILLSSLQSSTTASFYSKSKVFPPFPRVSKHIQELWFSQAFILEHNMCILSSLTPHNQCSLNPTVIPISDCTSILIPEHLNMTIPTFLRAFLNSKFHAVAQVI